MVNDVIILTMDQEKREKTIIFASAAYIALVIFANLGSLRIVSLVGLAVDGGSLLYPFTFTARDILHKKTGAKNTRFTIILAAAINLLLFAYCLLVGVLPADMSVGPQTEYAFVLMPGFRLVIGSIIAMTVAELLDTQIYKRVKQKYGSNRQWLRVLYSNSVSVPVDTLIFLIIAFAGRYPFAVIAGMFISNIIIKYVVSFLSFGGIYLVKEDRD